MEGLRSFILFSGMGPILIVTSCAHLADPRLVDQLHHKGIGKFIGYEVPVERVRTTYGVSFDVVVSDLEQAEGVRVLDFNGHHIFSCFRLGELGEGIKVGD